MKDKDIFQLLYEEPDKTAFYMWSAYFSMNTSTLLDTINRFEEHEKSVADDARYIVMDPASELLASECACALDHINKLQILISEQLQECFEPLPLGFENFKRLIKDEVTADIERFSSNKLPLNLEICTVIKSLDASFETDIDDADLFEVVSCLQKLCELIDAQYTGISGCLSVLPEMHCAQVDSNEESLNNITLLTVTLKNIRDGYARSGEAMNKILSAQKGQRLLTNYLPILTNYIFYFIAKLSMDILAELSFENQDISGVASLQKEKILNLYKISKSASLFVDGTIEQILQEEETYKLLRDIVCTDTYNTFNKYSVDTIDVSDDAHKKLTLFSLINNKIFRKNPDIF
jgi:hypothetical protein